MSAEQPSAILATTSGMKMMTAEVIVGTVFGEFTVSDTGKNIPGIRRCVCKCKCGALKELSIYSLLRGHSRSCGCGRLAILRTARIKSGARSRTDASPELRKFYSAWLGMRARCSNPKHKDFKYYGAIGIAVCDRWMEFEAFKADMWPRPEGKTLDRRDPNKGYSPDNCQWATHLEQRHNRRVT